MARDILVLVEQAGGRIDSITFQLLSVGYRLAVQMGVKLVAAVIGHQLESLVAPLQGHGPDKIVVVDHPALALASAEVQAYVIAELARQTDPRLVLIGYNLTGMELAPAIATRLGMNGLTNCVNVEIRAGSVMVTRPMFDSTMHAQIALEENESAVIALQKGSFPPLDVATKQAMVETLAVDAKNFPGRSRVIGITEEPKG